jgi:hypothetical protein
MIVDHDLGGSAAPREAGCPFGGQYASADRTMRQRRDRHADQVISAFQRDEPEYLNAMRMEFKRRVRDQNSR